MPTQKRATCARQGAFMAFDSAHLDWATHKHHTGGDAVYGDDWGDGSPRCLFRALGVQRERAEVDAEAHARYLARRAEIAADATRSRSAPVEAQIARERAERSNTAIAQAMRKAKARNKKR